MSLDHTTRAHAHAVRKVHYGTFPIEVYTRYLLVLTYQRLVELLHLFVSFNFAEV